MLTPELITAGSLLSFQFFQVGSTLYVLTFQKTAPCHMWFSLDQGITWTEADATNAPSTTSQDASMVWDGVTTLWVCTDDSITTNVNFTSFDTLTNTWGVSHDTGNGATDNFACALFWRVVDSSIIASCNVAGVTNHSRFFVFDSVGFGSTAWTDNGIVIAGQDCQVRGAFQGDGTDCWFTFLVLNPSRLIIQKLDATNTLGAIVVLDTGLNNAISQLPNCFSDGVNAIVAWCPDPFSTAINCFQGPVSTMVLTLSVATVPGGGLVQQFWTPVIDASGFTVVFNDLVDSIFSVTDSGGGYGVPQLLATGVGSLLVNIVVNLNPFQVAIDLRPPVSFLAANVPAALSLFLDPMTGGGAIRLPGITSCHFGRPKRCTSIPPILMISGDLVFALLDLDATNLRSQSDVELPDWYRDILDAL